MKSYGEIALRVAHEQHYTWNYRSPTDSAFSLVVELLT